MQSQRVVCVLLIYDFNSIYTVKYGSIKTAGVRLRQSK